MIIVIQTVGVDRRKFSANHLGINPVSGGSPLRDSKRIGINQLWGEWVIEELVNDVFVFLNKKNTGRISIEYMEKYISAGNFHCGDIRAITHPRWVIDEYAMMVRSFVWFMPMKPPINAFRAAITLHSGTDIFINSTNGPAFCTVDNKKHVYQEIEDMIEGYQ